VCLALDDIVKRFGKSGGFVVCQIKVHGPDMGSRSRGGYAVAGEFPHFEVRNFSPLILRGTAGVALGSVCEC
jgi:hypothetical protein